MKPFQSLLFFAALCCTLFLSAAESPHGICAHLCRGEFSDAEKELETFRKMGLATVRVSIPWKIVEPQRGEWDFRIPDKVFELAEKSGIEILLKLGDDLPAPWGTPVAKHHDDFLEFARRCAERYGNRVRYVEIFNEPNLLRFWKEPPDAKAYAELLAKTAAVVRQCAPGVKIVYGGLDGADARYLDTTLNAGAAESFDVMNIHPYQWYHFPESKLAFEIGKIRATLKKHGIDGKPLWITEIGLSTGRSRNPGYAARAIATALDALEIQPEKTIAVISDPEANYYTDSPRIRVEEMIPEWTNRKYITLNELAGLDAREYPALLLCADGAFPVVQIPALLDYCRRGGTLIFPFGLPLYYDHLPAGERPQINARFMKEFHIGWEAWWLRNSQVPKMVDCYEEAEGFAGLEAVPNGMQVFFHDRNLEAGDRFLPLLWGCKGNFRGVVGAIYRLNSSLKGNIVVLGNVSASDTVSETLQAQLLPRTFLIAADAGAKRIYHYCFRDGAMHPWREAYFGLMTRQNKPKEAAFACSTLVKMYPAGSTTPAIKRTGPIYTAEWKLPDGKRTVAVWTVTDTVPVKARVTGKCISVTDYLGRSRTDDPAKFSAGPGILYFTGDGEFSLTPELL